MEEQMRANDVSGREHMDSALDVQKKMLRMLRISYITNLVLVIALIAAAVILIPRTRAMSERVNTLMEQAKSTMKNTADSLSKFNKLGEDAEELIKNANKMVADNAGAVTETVNKLNEVDFVTLNEAIQNLNTAIKPLAEFAKMFNPGGGQ